jgi:hypothetical protein
MPDEKPSDITDFSRDELVRLVGMLLGDLLVHYGMWFTETLRYHDAETALKLENDVLRRYVPLALERLAPHFGIELDGNTPKVLASKSREDLLFLIGDIAKTWLTGDGLWFQAVESSRGMDAAKAVNDTCWSHFAQMEAFKIRTHLELGSRSGLKGLERALKLRTYSTINAHSSSWDDDGSLLFKMTECRVQAARRNKELEDYPCKSAGIAEYSQFARAIDPRIVTECVWCPPDRVPESEFCTWRFRMERS